MKQIISIYCALVAVIAIPFFLVFLVLLILLLPARVALLWVKALDKKTATYCYDNYLIKLNKESDK